MLTRKGYTGLLQKIWETGGLTPDMEEDVKRLTDDFDEREGMLRKFGEVYDGEDKDEYDYTPHEGDTRRDDNDWEGKYNEMKRRYIERFFGSEDTRAERNETVNDAKEDVQGDASPQTWDELLAKSNNEERKVENAD